ncbi:MAG: hypothetical protein VYD57_06170 [Pseudomonadota bacterium]|nr:hypothetical protein [Pseudomonadota bacterium]
MAEALAIKPVKRGVSDVSGALAAPRAAEGKLFDLRGGRNHIAKVGTAMNDLLTAYTMDANAKASPQAFREVPNRLNHLGILHGNEKRTNTFCSSPSAGIIRALNR